MPPPASSGASFSTLTWIDRPPRSILTISVPSLSLSPSMRAPAAARKRSSGDADAAP